MPRFRSPRPTSLRSSQPCDVSLPSLDRETYTLDELIDEVVGADDELVAVPVHKHRAHHRSTAAWRS